MAYVPTAEQGAILAHVLNRNARVLAGPGTGKSATLLALMDRLLGDEPEPRIKLLTFTRAATAELAKKVSDHPAAATQRPSTIHSFSISVLLRNPGTGNFPEPLRIADDWEDGEIVYPTFASIPPNELDFSERGTSTARFTGTFCCRSCPTPFGMR